MAIKELGKNASKEIAIALIGVILTVLFEFVTLEIVKPEEIDKLKANQGEITKLLAVQFDLYIISLALILGSASTREPTSKTSRWLILLFVGGLLILLTLPIISKISPEHLSNWFRIWIPDILGFVMIWIAAHVVRGS